MHAVLALLTLASAYELCFPPSCTIDANCYDSIHGAAAKCCGGSCVFASSLRTRLVGEPCDLTSGPDSYESCNGPCAAGLMCSTVDRKCHLLKETACNCTSSSECLDRACSPTPSGGTGLSCVPAYGSVPAGGFCYTSSDCQSQQCNTTTNQCIYLSLGASCSPASPQACGPNAICRLNSSAYVCTALCASNVSNCCQSSTMCRAAGDYCDTSTGTCVSYPGLNETCSTSCNNASFVCATSCNETACYFPRICQLPNQLQNGGPCSSSSQCATNSSCLFNGNTSVCVGNVSVGGLCNVARNCAPPATICSPINGTYACRVNGSTPIGELCSSSQECVNISECVSNGTYSTCTAKLAFGDTCYSGSRMCIGGPGTCVPPVFGGSCSSPSFGCTCGVPGNVSFGGNCTLSVQCKEESSCANGVCVPFQGKSCNTTSDCVSSKYECNCNRECYLAYPPTPPPAPTPAPTMCNTEMAAFMAVQPASFQWPSTPGVVTATTFQQGAVFGSVYYPFVTNLLRLTAEEQTLAIDFACCMTCPRNQRFSAISYQVDCAANTLKTFPASCNIDRNELAFINCWTSAAMPLSGLSLVAALFLGLLL